MPPDLFGLQRGATPEGATQGSNLVNGEGVDGYSEYKRIWTVVKGAGKKTTEDRPAMELGWEGARLGGQP